MSLPPKVMAESRDDLRWRLFASGHDRDSQAHTDVVRAFPALLLGQDSGKMMVRGAMQAWERCRFQ